MCWLSCDSITLLNPSILWQPWKARGLASHPFYRCRHWGTESSELGRCQVLEQQTDFRPWTRLLECDFTFFIFSHLPTPTFHLTKTLWEGTGCWGYYYLFIYFGGHLTYTGKWPEKKVDTFPLLGRFHSWLMDSSARVSSTMGNWKHPVCMLMFST